MINLTQAVRVAYKSAAVACASARARQIIARKAHEIAKKELDPLPDDAARRLVALKATLWYNYQTAQSIAIKFCTDEEVGSKLHMELLWQQLGNNVADLPDWDTIFAKDLKTVISFKNFNGLDMSVIEAAEANFTGNVHEIPTTDFPTQFEEMLDLFLNDLWAAEGMRIWANNQLNRAAETAADLEYWDKIMFHSNRFFNASRACCRKSVTMFYQYENNFDHPPPAKMRRYVFRASHQIKARRGLFALEASDLPPRYISKIENKTVTYR